MKRRRRKYIKEYLKNKNKNSEKFMILPKLDKRIIEELRSQNKEIKDNKKAFVLNG